MMILISMEKWNQSTSRCTRINTQAFTTKKWMFPFSKHTCLFIVPYFTHTQTIREGRNTNIVNYSTTVWGTERSDKTRWQFFAEQLFSLVLHMNHFSHRQHMERLLKVAKKDDELIDIIGNYVSTLPA